MFYSGTLHVDSPKGSSLKDLLEKKYVVVRLKVRLQMIL